MILRRVIFTGLLVVIMNVPPYVSGADLISKINPYVSIKEEYSDNLNLKPTNRQSDFITTIQPGIKFSNMDKVSGIDLDYRLGAVFYEKKTNLNYISHNASLNAKYLSAGHINFYLRESFTRSDEPREQEYFTSTGDNRYLLATNTERAIYWRNVVAPTIEYQFGPESRLGVNYRNNIYRTESATGQNSREDYINPFFSYWFNKQNGISLEYGLTYGKFDRNPDLTGHRASARYTSRFSARTSAFAAYSYSRRTFDSFSSPDYDIHEPTVGMTFVVTPTWTVSAQAGYFWTEPSAAGSKKSGISYRGDLVNIDPRTTYSLSFQGGYTEDFFTSENLGFNRYHRVTGSLTHMLDRRLSIGFMGSAELAEFDLPAHKDTTWGIGGRASYMPLRWLTFTLDVSHRERRSNVDLYDYTENRGIFTITATY